MKSTEKIALLFAALLLLSCLGGCAASARQSTVPYKVFLISKSTQTEFWKSVFAGARAAKSEYNIDLTILGPKTEEDYEVQNDYIRRAVDAGADAIVFSAISYTENAPAIDEAIEAGLKVVIIDSDVASEGVSVRIGTDNVAAGRISAEAALDTDLDSIVVGIVNAYAETQNCQERERGFREVLLGDDRVKGIYTVNTQTNARMARQAAEKLMQDHPEINVLVGFNEPLAVGTAQAVNTLGLIGRVHTIAFDTNIKCIEMLQTGAVSALIVQNPYAMGYLGIEKAWEVLQGTQFDAQTLLDTTATIVTQENMFTLESQKALFSFG